VAAHVFIAIEVSKRDWLVAGHTPRDRRTSGEVGRALEEGLGVGEDRLDAGRAMVTEVDQEVAVELQLFDALAAVQIPPTVTRAMVNFGG
jgi:hypothetical protein